MAPSIPSPLIPPPPGICRAFSNSSFPRVGHLLKQVSPGVGHCQSNVIFRILKVVHKALFILNFLKFPDYPQYKNIKTELINVVWVDPALFKGTGTYPPHHPTPTCSLVPRVLLFPSKSPCANEKMAETFDNSFDSFVGQDTEFVSSWLRHQGLGGLVETFIINHLNKILFLSHGSGVFTLPEAPPWGFLLMSLTPAWSICNII